MLPKIKEEMLLQFENLEDLRQLFKEGDKDHSNFLSKEELRACLLKLGADLSEEQLGELIGEMDEDENAQIDIDEFVAFLTVADQLKFKHEGSRRTLVNIRRARKLNAVDFFNCFKGLPQNYAPSCTQERFEKHAMFTPSWGLFPMFNYNQMTYKDLTYLRNLDKMPQKEFLKVYMPRLFSEISIEEATNIPIPRKEDFPWEKISVREIRAFLFDFTNKEFLSNTLLMTAQWNEDSETKWVFN